MPYPRPTLSQLKAQVASDIQSALPGSDPLLRFSNLNIIGTALANLSNDHYGYLDWISLQSNPFTATDEYLYAWGALKCIYSQAATVSNNGAITFTGTNGTILPAGTQLVRSDGAIFVNGTAQTISNGSVIVTVTASVAGTSGNTAVGAVMSLGTSINGINSTGSVSTAFTNGTDVETKTAFRSRVLEAYQQPPQGGSFSDYIGWARKSPGVTRAWCVPRGMGIGTVVVYVMLDVIEEAFNGFPQGANGVAAAEPRGVTATGDQLSVANYIYALQPVQSLVYVVSPIPNLVNFTISGLASASLTVKNTITTEFQSVFTQNTILGGTNNLIDFEIALETVPGAGAGLITSPTTNIVSGAGQLPALGTITYV